MDMCFVVSDRQTDWRITANLQKNWKWGFQQGCWQTACTQTHTHAFTHHTRRLMPVSVQQVSMMFFITCHSWEWFTWPFCVDLERLLVKFLLHVSSPCDAEATSRAAAVWPFHHKPWKHEHVVSTFTLPVDVSTPQYVCCFLNSQFVTVTESSRVLFPLTVQSSDQTHPEKSATTYILPYKLNPKELCVYEMCII